MVNKERPHLMVLPEDRKDNDLANGFRQHLDIEANQMHILPPAGGWTHVRDAFVTDHIREMRRYRHRWMVLLVDFDRREDRYARVFEAVPEDLRDRVFVLGCSDEPEDLRRELSRSVEEIGEALADECVSNRRVTWNHPMLAHNAVELDRLCLAVRGFLIPSAA